jgi:hypothetical protein
LSTAAPNLKAVRFPASARLLINYTCKQAFSKKIMPAIMNQEY